jgi:LmbE family N-acetylglucosaminyl deacetylase
MIALGPAPGPLSVLCLGAHPDDVEIGCGGTLLELAARPGTTVRTVGLTAADPGRRREAEVAAESFSPGSHLTVLDLPDSRLPDRWDDTKQALEDVAAGYRPDLVLLPRVDDAHQDHRLVGRLASTVWRDSLLLHYEIPKWDADLVPPTHYVAVSEENARRKVALLDHSYPSQRGRDWWDEELFLGLMRLRGVESRNRYAEGFFSAKVNLGLVPTEVTA